MNAVREIQLRQAGSDDAYRDWADYGLEFVRDTVGMLQDGPYKEAYEHVVVFLDRKQPLDQVPNKPVCP